MKRIYLLIFLFLSSVSYAEDILLSFPVDCDYGKNCFIQNYVDLDNSKNHQDYRCNRLSYNAHKGTDVRLLDYVQMEQGVKVLAAEDGIVKAIRNDQDDFKYLEKGEIAVLKKECGNGIVIDISNGYELQYCHMKKGSVTVKEGQKIKKGDVLGLIGMSGKTEFPHLHLALRKNGKIIDPFTALSPTENYNCNNPTQNNYFWDRELEYIETAILHFNITDQVPNKESARKGRFRNDSLKSNIKQIILWADIMGIQKEDKILFEILDSKNKAKIFSNSQIMKKPYAQYFIYSGKKINNIKKGNYNAKIKIFRKDKMILQQTKKIEVI